MIALTIAYFLFILWLIGSIWFFNKTIKNIILLREIGVRIDELKIKLRDKKQ